MTIIKLDQKRPLDPNLKDGKGRTWLHKLCCSYSVTVNEIRQALKDGADVNDRCSKFPGKVISMTAYYINVKIQH